MKYFVRAHRSTGMAYVHSKGGKRYTSKDRADATIFSSKKKAQALADELNRGSSDISANVETVYWENPAPSPASRSAKFHRLRAKLLTQLQIAKRKGSFVLEQSIGQKLRKLDRMFYAPRTVKRRK